MQQLFQDEPYRISTFTRAKNHSFTDSLESYQNGAHKELQILQRNGRIPTTEIVLHFLVEYEAKVINLLRKKIFLYLAKHGLEADVSSELTKGVNGQPNNTVHYHILTDDPRSKSEVLKLMHTACKQYGLVRDRDYRVNYRKLYNGYTYFRYFTKYGYETPLFCKGTGIQKFYQIGKWFKKGKIKIWDEIKKEMQEKYGTEPDVTDENESLPDERDLPGVPNEPTHGEIVVAKNVANRYHGELERLNRGGKIDDGVGRGTRKRDSEGSKVIAGRISTGIHRTESEVGTDSERMEPDPRWTGVQPENGRIGSTILYRQQGGTTINTRGGDTLNTLGEQRTSIDGEQKRLEVLRGEKLRELAETGLWTATEDTDELPACSDFYDDFPEHCEHYAQRTIDQRHEW